MMKNNKIVAIIPMRKESKRLKDKNIHLLASRPLYWYTSNQVSKSQWVDYVVVSTDYDFDELIPLVWNDVTFVLRPKSLCGDGVSSEDVVKHVLQEHGDGFDVVVLLQVTSPLRTWYDIDNAIDLFFKNNNQAVMSVSESNHSVPNGAIYILTVKDVYDGKKFSDPSCICYLMNDERSIDIDTLDDFKKAESIIKKGRID